MAGGHHPTCPLGEPASALGLLTPYCYPPTPVGISYGLPTDCPLIFGQPGPIVLCGCDEPLSRPGKPWQGRSTRQRPETSDTSHHHVARVKPTSSGRAQAPPTLHHSQKGAPVIVDWCAFGSPQASGQGRGNDRRRQGRAQPAAVGERVDVCAGWLRLPCVRFPSCDSALDFARRYGPKDSFARSILYLARDQVKAVVPCQYLKERLMAVPR